ncbi:enoyl-CoA hydratase/isomerase family protein [Virgibacillus sp. MSP4-1]|uniref:enoyl-CoA hydratase/isomerase family protein n=1 Tax=Virgibacillus sp. MSP4-1 TaxID=2700081 RepID=UPI0003A8975A|nr:enoyl-CoA hydratase/isomerase family protein [Virgibacillus sp. MSP4-1]QHS22152.1 enoyl-CoA hydratase/isomerase family protein [Virgibacillus sp. MSP4-1]
MFDTIRYEYDSQDHFAKITLNRPEKRNAVSLEMGRELNEILDNLSQNKELKFLVITGSGNKSFCAGGDLYDFHGAMDEGKAYEQLRRLKTVLYKLASFPLPTICILNGDARGGGCELATACDFRFAEKNTRHGFIQGKLGITPGWGGGVLLYKRILPLLAYQWLLESDMRDAGQLQQMGWIQKLFSEGQGINELVKPFIEKQRAQLHSFKKQYINQYSLDQLADDMDMEVKNCARLWVSDEHKQAVEAFFKRGRKK